MNKDVSTIHIGEHIAERLRELKMTKTEFAKRFGILPQHVNKLLSNKSIDTDKLVRISEILDFNFFTLYCPGLFGISAYRAAIVTAKNGKATHIEGDAALQSKLEATKERIKDLESMIKDKNKIISLLEAQLDAQKQQ